MARYARSYNATGEQLMAGCESEKEMYDRFCKDRFDKMDKQFDKVDKKLDNYIDIMFGLLKGSNGNPGVMDDVRDLKKINRAMTGAIVFLISTLVIQAVAWGWQKIFTQ